MEDCLARRTRLETLLLVLIVAVLVLIPITIVYILPAFQKCPNCKDFCTNIGEKLYSDDFTRRKHDDDDDNECPPDVYSKEIEKSKYIASVIEGTSSNGLSTSTFLCAGAVLSLKWVISSGTCIGLRHTLQNSTLYIRAGSIYWVKGGDIQKVTDVLLYDNLIAVYKLEMQFNKDFVQPVLCSANSFFTNHKFMGLSRWFSEDLDSADFDGDEILQIEQVMVLYDNCEWNKTLNTYCVTSLETFPCGIFKGAVVMVSNFLVGISIKQYCTPGIDDSRDIVYDISNLMYWLKDITYVYIIK